MDLIDDMRKRMMMCVSGRVGDVLRFGREQPARESESLTSGHFASGRDIFGRLRKRDHGCSSPGLRHLRT